MPGKNSKLRYALDKEKGRNIPLEKQRKREKEAAKRKRGKEAAAQHSGHGDQNDVFRKEATKGKRLNRDETSESEDDELVGVSDLEREEQELPEDGWDDISSEDSEAGDDDELLNGLKKSDLIGGIASAEAAVAAEATEDEDEEDEKAEADDVPLSDLEDASDSEDITPHQRLTTNNTAALTRALEAIRLPLPDLPFSTHQSMTSEQPTSISDTNDDLNRELALYKQSLEAVRRGRSLLLAEGAPFTRPSDYFAEMVKTDEHMGKVKGRLVSDAAARKASEDAKRQRQLKKFGKAVQQEKLKERAQAKKEMLEKVSALKRKRKDTGGIGGQGQGEEDLFDVAVEDAAAAEREKKRMKRDGRDKGKQAGKPNMKRQQRDEKFGFGGQKRHAKSNDATSTGDMRSFSMKKMKSGSGTKAKGAKRLGKSRRQKLR